MKFKILLIAFLTNFCVARLFSQTDSSQTIIDTSYNYTAVTIDSVAVKRDSFIKDSLTWQYLRIADAMRPNLFIDSLLRKYLVKDPYLLKPYPGFLSQAKLFGTGKPKKMLDFWVLFMLFGLICSFGILRVAFAKETALIFQSFFNNRVLNQINKEDNIFVSWQFLFLYILFALTLGLYLFLLTYKLGINYSYSGFKLYLIISFVFTIIFTLKIIVLRFIGFIFDIKKAVRDYVNIIYLSYFNLSFFFLPLTLILSLSTDNFTNLIIIISITLLLLILGVQFFRAIINILSNYRFSKIYLFLYLCALEICPVFILIKALKV